MKVYIVINIYSQVYKACFSSEYAAKEYIKLKSLEDKVCYCYLEETVEDDPERLI